MNAVVSIEDARLARKGHRTVDQFSVKVEPGEAVAITGLPGSGRSTVLRSALGLTLPEAGQVWLFGQDTKNLDHDDLMSLRQRCAYASVHSPPLANLSALENVSMPLVLRGMDPDEAEALAVDALERLGLQEAQASRPEVLHLEELALLCVARTLVLPVELLVLDQPFDALGARTAPLVQKELTRRVAEGAAVLLSGDPDEDFSDFQVRRVALDA
jgi:ABC-type lipoprotein export system ATPase subunit